MTGMKPPSERKLYLGPRLRVLRRELGLNQSQMASELGVSPSYLNHLERNQRPLSAQMLLRLAEAYDLDIRSFVSGASAESAGDLKEIFADPLVADIGVPRDEINELAENHPGVVEAMSRLYRAYGDLKRLPHVLGGQAARDTGPLLGGFTDFVHAHANHFAEIDAAAEALAGGLPQEPAELYVALRQRLSAEFAVETRVVADSALGPSLRFYDYHRKRLLISERLPASGRLFAAAYQLCLLALEAPVAALLTHEEVPARAMPLFRLGLTNYAAAALVMPYGRFFAAAEESRYDLTLLQTRFGVSFEQLAHRLTTLGRPGARGVPFFMLKVDIAGTVSKRFTGEGVPLARFGGGCPRWNLFRAFRSPGQTLSEVVEMPDGERFFTMSRTLTIPSRPVLARGAQVIALGCAARHMARLAAADAVTGAAANPIGPACAVCDRAQCPDRALPPVTRGLDLNPLERPAAPFPFAAG